jgi:hypothetical protein
MAAFSSVPGRPLADPGWLRSGAQAARRRGGAVLCHANPAEIPQTRVRAEARAGPGWRAGCGPPPPRRAVASLPGSRS